MPSRSARRIAALLVPAVLTAGHALAQGAELLRLAPPIAELGRITPLDAPVEVTRAGWAEFRRICTETAALRGTTPRPGERVCLRAQATAEPGGWRVRVEPEPRGTGAVPVFTMLRRDDGSVSDVTAAPPAGSAPLAAAQRAGLLATGRATLEGLGIARQRLAPGTRFTLPLPRFAEDAAPGGRGLDCLPEGRARLAGREVVVARCLARLEGRLTAAATGSVLVAGNFAVDIGTGLVVAQSYATRLETFAAAPGQAPRSNGVVITTSRTRIE